MTQTADNLMLCRTRRGSALHCACCGRVEIAFGNAILTVDDDELRSMLEIVDSFDLDTAPRLASEGRVFLIRTQHDDAAFAFSRREALELRQLIRGARRALRRQPPISASLEGLGARTSHLH